MLRKARSGFTLIELLVVVVIIGILASIGVKGFGAAQDRARNSSMVSNVRTVALGVENWKTDNPGVPKELVKEGVEDAKEALASGNVTVSGTFPKYLPGGKLPRTPWAKAPQIKMAGAWSNATLAPDGGGSGGQDGLADPVITGEGAFNIYESGPQKGAMVAPGNTDAGTFPPATGPENRTDYGFIFYAGSSNTGRYGVFGVCKNGDKPLIMAVKTNF